MGDVNPTATPAATPRRNRLGVTMTMTGARWFMLGVAGVAILFAYGTYALNARQSGSAAESNAGSAANRTGVRENVAGSTDSTPRYNTEVTESNQRKAELAKQQGRSFVATPVVAKSEKEVASMLEAPRPDATPQPTPQHTAPKQTEQVYQRPANDPAVANQIAVMLGAIDSARTPGETRVIYSEKAASTRVSQTLEAGARSTSVVSPVGSQEHPLLPAGRLVYGVFETRLQSNVPGPVLGTLVQGELNGWKVLGAFEKIESSDLLMIRMTQAIDKNGVAHAINGVVVSPETTLPAMATDVDYHAFSRTVSFLGAAFLGIAEGYASALSKSGSSVIMDGNSTVVTYPELTDQQLAAIAVGSMSNNLKVPIREMEKQIVQPNTVIVKEGSPFVLMVVKGTK